MGTGRGTRGPPSPLRVPSRASPGGQEGKLQSLHAACPHPRERKKTNPISTSAIFRRNLKKKTNPKNPLKSALERLVHAHIFLLNNSREEDLLDKKAGRGLPREEQERGCPAGLQPGGESSYQQLWDRQGLPFLAQGDVGEEGADSTVPLPRLVHEWVGVHKDFDFHGFIARESHAPRNGDDAACEAERGRLSRQPLLLLRGREQGVPRVLCLSHVLSGASWHRTSLTGAKLLCQCVPSAHPRKPGHGTVGEQSACHHPLVPFLIFSWKLMASTEAVTMLVLQWRAATIPATSSMSFMVTPGGQR